MPELTRTSPKPDIMRFQRDLEFLGFPLPRFHADGDLGSETISAGHDAAERFNLPAPGQLIVPAGLVDGLRALVVAKQASPIPKPLNFVDLTEKAWPGPRVKKVPISIWEGLLFHTTGCPMGRATWDKERIYKRWSHTQYKNDEGTLVNTSLKAHFGITQAGDILMVHPLEWFIWHAQQGSKICPGVEVESFDYGVVGDKKSLPGGGFDIMPINDKQVQACFDLAEWFHAVSLRYGGKGIQKIHTHTQFTDDRDPDIGEVGYKKIILPLMEKYGVTDGGPEFRVGKGRRIPKQWNAAYPLDYHDPKR